MRTSNRSLVRELVVLRGTIRRERRHKVRLARAELRQTVEVRFGSNCEQLTPGTHFRVAPNNRHGTAERKRRSLPSAAKPLRATSGQIAFGFLEKNRRWRDAIFLAASERRLRRSMVGWSTGTRMVGVNVAIAHEDAETLRRDCARRSRWSMSQYLFAHRRPMLADTFVSCIRAWRRACRAHVGGSDQHIVDAIDRAKIRQRARATRRRAPVAMAR